MSSELEALGRVLGDRPPPAFATLEDRELAALSGALETALERQSAELEAASERALQHVPRMLRGTVKRVVFG
jgi:hypothetical protein